MVETAMAWSSQGSQRRDAVAPQPAFELQSHLALTKTRKGKLQEQEFSGLGVILHQLASSDSAANCRYKATPQEPHRRRRIPDPDLQQRAGW